MLSSKRTQQLSKSSNNFASLEKHRKEGINIKQILPNFFF